MMADESVLERRAKEKRKKERRARTAEGTAATHAARGRTAERPGAAGGRVDYTPKPAAKTLPLIKGKAAKHSSGKIGPKERILKVN
jgi:hypothetical protein